jgi:hypothetical protein
MDGPRKASIVTTGIRRAFSSATDARQAVQEFYESVVQPGMELVLFFCSNDYDLDNLADEMRLRFGSTRVVGCTTAGEIGPAGYLERGLAGVSFSARVCSSVGGHLDRLQQFEIPAGQTLAQHLLQELLRKQPQANAENSFALLLIDGLSVREEPVARILQAELGRIPLAGGSAGDGLEFKKAYVYADGSFRSDRAALTLITTPLPFTVFKTQHFVATDHRLVITAADTAHRVVHEIDGLPAAQEYARLLGVALPDLSPSCFAASPVVVLIDGNNYVRSIQKVNGDGSMTFYCAIEEGLVLRVARGVDLIQNLEEAFTHVRSLVGPPLLVIGCDCLLRRLEIVQNHLEGAVGDMFRSNNTIGFNTYGEQFRGVHVNQTLSGIALGSPSTEAHDS